MFSLKKSGRVRFHDFSKLSLVCQWMSFVSLKRLFAGIYQVFMLWLWLQRGPRVKATSVSFNKVLVSFGKTAEKHLQLLNNICFFDKEDSASFKNDELAALKSRVSKALCEGTAESPELGNKHGLVFICVSLNAVAPRVRKRNLRH